MNQKKNVKFEMSRKANNQSKLNEKKTQCDEQPKNKLKK